MRVAEATAAIDVDRRAVAGREASVVHGLEGSAITARSVKEGRQELQPGVAVQGALHKTVRHFIVALAVARRSAPEGLKKVPRRRQFACAKSERARQQLGMSVYAAGRGLTGAFAARLLLHLAGPYDVASSGAALVSLALLLGGESALNLLRAPRYASLLLGLGLGAAPRLALARRWLRALSVPPDLRLSELLLLRRPRLHVILYDGLRQAPVLYGLCGVDAPLAEVVGALCSLAPLGSRRLFDVEALVAAEALAGALRPLPLLVLAPWPSPVAAPGCFAYAGKVLGLLERLLLRTEPPTIVCRAATPSALAGLGSFVPLTEPWGGVVAQAELRRGCAAALILYVVAGLLQALRQPQEGASSLLSGRRPGAFHR